MVGLGPAGPELITAGTLALIEAAGTLVLRTRRHPSAAGFDGAASFDHLYEVSETFEEAYRVMVDALVAAATEAEATGSGPVVYAVPGSPTVAERTVVLLREHPAVVTGTVELAVHPALGFLDLAFARMGVDPVAAGVRVVDAGSFAVEAAGERGPLLVAQCWSRAVLSEIKLSVESGPSVPVLVLHHLGLADERVDAVAWDELDRSFAPDHLTSLWIPELATPVAAELVQLDELVRTLRQRCPWDRRQTHGSLARHLLEESYEVLEAIDEVAALDAGAHAGGPDDGPRPDQLGSEAVDHLEEELGDLLFQVYFHAALAAEAGRFTLADVARGVHDKLVARHPHVFGDVVADTPEDVAANWEANKLVEKGRSNVTEGIPAALPALALTSKLQKKATSVGMVLPGVADEATRVAEAAAVLGGGREPMGEGAVAELLFSVVNLARMLDVDPEAALRARASSFRREIVAGAGRG